jgi:hypothetical protein
VVESGGLSCKTKLLCTLRGVEFGGLSCLLGVHLLSCQCKCRCVSFVFDGCQAVFSIVGPCLLGVCGSGLVLPWCSFSSLEY